MQHYSIRIIQRPRYKTAGRGAGPLPPVGGGPHPWVVRRPLGFCPRVKPAKKGGVGLMFLVDWAEENS